VKPNPYRVCKGCGIIAGIVSFVAALFSLSIKTIIDLNFKCRVGTISEMERPCHYFKIHVWM